MSFSILNKTFLATSAADTVENAEAAFAIVYRGGPLQITFQPSSGQGLVVTDFLAFTPNAALLVNDIVGGGGSTVIQNAIVNDTSIFGTYPVNSVFDVDVFANFGIDYSQSNAGVRIDLLKGTASGGYADGDTLGSGAETVSNITGSSFNDVIRGSNLFERDLFIVAGSPPDFDITLFDPGNNVLSGGAGDDVLEGRGGADTLDGGPGFDYASYESSPAGVNVRLPGVGGTDTQTAIATNGDAAGDSFISIEGLIGSRFNDTLTGNSLDNVIAGGLGSDILNGMGGNDTADYSRDHFYDLGLTHDSADRVEVNLGLNGAAGTAAKFVSVFNPATLTTSLVPAGTDQLISIENVTGTGGNDVIVGNERDNVLDGRGGDDLMDGGLGNDTIIGNRSEIDVASYQSHDSVPLLVLEQDVISLSLNGADGSYTRTGLVGLARAVFETDVLRGIEGVVGSNKPETINGDELNNYFQGRGGNDIINGGPGNDIYDMSGPDSASLGADVYFDSSGNDEILINSLSDIVLSGVARIGNDLFVPLVNGSFRVVDQYAGQPIETVVPLDTGKAVTLSTLLTGGNLPGIIVAGNGGETLNGNGGDDLLFGGNGADRLIGGIGNDILTGGNGADTFGFGVDFGNDVISDFSPADRIEFDDGLFGSFKAVEAASQQVGKDTVITLDADDSIVLQGVALKSLRANQFIFVSVPDPTSAPAATGATSLPNVDLLSNYMASTFVPSGNAAITSGPVGLDSAETSMTVPHGR